MFTWRLDVVSFKHVAFDVVEFFITNLAQFFPAVGFENFMGNPEVLVKVGYLLSTFWTRIFFLEMNKFHVGVMV